MVSTDAPASTKYELSKPVGSRLWGAKALGALIVSLIVQDDVGYGGACAYRYRIRNKRSGNYVYEVTTSPGGVDAQTAERSLAQDLERLSIDDFERLYGIMGRG